MDADKWDDGDIFDIFWDVFANKALMFRENTILGPCLRLGGVPC